MKIVAAAPTDRAAHATAWPWLPALAATTPAARERSSSCAILLYAPRTLNEPVSCRFSAFRKTSRPARRVNVWEWCTGVVRATPPSRARADSMSASVGAVFVCNVEHLLHDLANRSERIELPRLDFLEQAPELRLVRDCVLEMTLRARRRDGEDLAGEVPPAPLVEPAALLEVAAVLHDRVPELGHAFAPRRLRQQDRRPPLCVAVEGDDRAHLVKHRLRRGMIHLVDRDHVRDLHDPRLQRLHRVARAGHQHEQHRVRDADHLDLALTGADGLEEDELLPGRVEDEQRLQRRLREAAEMAARPHRADEHARVEEVVRKANPVAEERALRERARRVDGDDPDGAVLRAHVRDERADQARLADARRPGDADRVGVAGLSVDVGDELVRGGIGALDERDRARERATVAGAHAC